MNQYEPMPGETELQRAERISEACLQLGVKCYNLGLNDAASTQIIDDSRRSILTLKIV